MLTQCPGCQTVFRVTSTILRAAHGQVRCGRCNLQFDAIAQLLDSEDDTSTEASLPAEQATAAFDKDALSHELPHEELTHEEIVLEGNRIEISGVYRHLDATQPDGDEADHTRTVIEEFNVDSETWENPFASQESTPGNTATTDGEPDAELLDVEEELSAGELADALASLEGAAPADTSAPPPAPSDELSPPSQAEPPITAITAQRSPPADVDEAFMPRRESRRQWPWIAAGSVLSLLLIGQTLHHYRQALARHPSFGPHLSQLYQAIGQPLTPQWQLAAYSIKQWGIVSDPQESGTLRVRASVTNGAAFAQPYPLLRLSLEDRFGSQVGQRDFKPEEYLDTPALATRLLNAGAAANIDLAILDPGQEAVGFQFDTCLTLPQGLQCSHDLLP
ncbi:MAG: DUF3426 domain-containing protein [Paludibacter sp.]